MRAIVLKDDALLVMHRNKFGQDYYTLVGGGIKLGEQPEDTLRREVQEETGLQITNPRLVFVEETDDMHGPQYIYLCDYQSGEVALHPHSPEAQIHALGKNLYTPQWLPVQKFAEVEFLSPSLRQRIINGLARGWPQQPEVFKHIHI